MNLQQLRFSRPFHGLHLSHRSNPTDESVGYYHSSAAPTFEAKPNRLTKPVLAALLGLVCFSGTCFERHASVTLTKNTNPPSFKLSGNGWLYDVYVSGPFLSVDQVKSTRWSDSILWRVDPKVQIMSRDIPEITYGSTGDWGKQVIPANGEPPKPLEEAKVYVIWGTVAEANFRELCLTIKNGQVIDVECARK